MGALKKKDDQSLLSALGRMASGISHEINNPLMIIQGYSMAIDKFLADGKIDEARAFNKKIVTAADRIAVISKHLRSLSKDSSQDPPILCDVRDLLAMSAELLREKFSSSRVEFIFDVTSSKAVLCRPAEVARVLLHLLLNSFEAVSSLERPWVKLVFSEGEIEGESVAKFQVIDSGNGIDPEVQNKMFNPFFTTKETNQGPGLGLSLAKTIIEEQGGKIWYELKDGHTSVCFTLPQGAT